MKDFSMLQLTECEPGIVSELSSYFEFEVPGAKFMPAVKRRVWDGKIRMLDRNTGEINAGLYWAIKKFAMERGYGIKVEQSDYGYPYDTNKVNHLQTMTWIDSLNMPYKPRDYQYDALTHGIKYKRAHSNFSHRIR